MRRHRSLLTPATMLPLLACATACGSNDVSIGPGGTGTGANGSTSATSVAASVGSNGSTGPGGGASAGSGGNGSTGSGAGGDPLAGVCRNTGWCELPNTTLESVCAPQQDIQGNTGCEAVISAWSSGVADLAHNRLLFWGGGHGDYYGNEIYALDLGDQTMKRLNDPSPYTACVEETDDGKPVSRHTYDGLVYMSKTGLVYMYGGARGCTEGVEGIKSEATWTLDPATLAWTRKDPVGGPAENPDCCDYIPAADYDPVTDKVLMEEEGTLWSYDLGADAYEQVGYLYGVDYQQTAVVDPKRRMLFIVGNQQFWAIDIGAGSSYEFQDWSGQVTGCEALLSVEYPGLDYDSALGAVVGWAGGDSVSVFDPDTKTCTEKTFPNGPGSAQNNGTFKRWRYFPNADAFALVNDWQQNAFVLRL